MTRDQKILAIFSGVFLIAGYFALSKSARDGASETFSEGVDYIMTTANAISNFGLDFIKNIEGFSSRPYKDAKGWSIGYGHFLGESDTAPALSWSQSDAEAALASDTETAQNAVRNMVKVPINQNQFDALTSLVYNIGATAFQRSTLLAKLNREDYGGAAAQFGVWVRSRSATHEKGVVNPSLVARRDAEKQIFLS